MRRFIVFCSVFVVSAVFLQFSQAQNVLWQCQGRSCSSCLRNQCPTDTRLFDSQASCAQNCPLTPDCYFCMNEKCTPAYNLGCYGDNPMVKYTKDQLQQCQTVCEKQGDTAKKSGSRCGASLLTITGVVVGILAAIRL